MKIDTKLEGLFNIVWISYPKKQAKGAARKEFYRRCKEALDVVDYMTKLMDAIKTYKKTSWWIENPHKIPMLSSFIRDEREEDELEAHMFPDGLKPTDKPKINLREIE